MSLNSEGITDALVTHAELTGEFESVNKHEPKKSPEPTLTASCWIQRIRPARSGLAMTSAKLEFKIRLYMNMLYEPQDAIDPRILRAVDALMTAYTGNFRLDLTEVEVGAEAGSVRCVDLLGQEGEPLSAEAGYIEIGGSMFRCMDVTVPLIVNNAWEQAA